MLAFSNQFHIIGYVDGITISSLAPNSTCPRWLGMPRRKVYARHSMGGDARRDTKTSASEPVHPTFLRQRKGKMLHKHLRCRRIHVSSQGHDLSCPSYLCAGKVPIHVWLWQVVGRRHLASGSSTILVLANHDSNRYSKALQSDPNLNLLNCWLQKVFA